jgi:hypothetical protein
MVPVMSLWLPIIVAAVIVFIVSSIVHMLTPLHRGDWRKLPKEDATMDALRAFNIPPGDYAVPCASGPASMNTPEFQDKMKKGPRVFMTVLPGGPFSMTSNLVNWFLYCIVVGFFTAYVSGVALGPGADYLKVFQVAGCVSFMAYTMALPQASIWYSRNWGTTFRSMIDGLIYGLMTAGAFGWLWPK